jgi:hypothetical protein
MAQSVSGLASPLAFADVANLTPASVNGRGKLFGASLFRFIE